MKRKMILLSVSLSFLLVAISFATVTSMENVEEKKESPLFAVRTNKINNFRSMIQNSNFLNSNGRLFLINKIVNNIQLSSIEVLNKKIDPSYAAAATCISGCSWPCDEQYNNQDDSSGVIKLLGHKAPTCGHPLCTWSSGFCPSFNNGCQ